MMAGSASVTDQEIQEIVNGFDEVIAQREATYQLLIAEAKRQPAELRKLALLMCGDFYTPIKSVLIGEEVSYNDKGSFEDLRRAQAPTATERLQSVRRPTSYTLTLQKSIPSRLRRLASNESSPLDVETTNAMFPTDILGIPRVCNRTGAHVLCA
jgi:hypothetical protein